MTLIKKSQRTLREGCRKCGTTEVYWAHDDTRPGKGYVMIDATDLTRGIRQGGEVPAAYLHACFTSEPAAAGFTPMPGSSTSTVEPAADVSPDPTPEPAPGPIPTGLQSGDDMAMFRDMMQRIIGMPQIDRAEVENIAREIIDGIVYPTNTVVVSAYTGETKQLAGSTHYQLAEVIEWIEDGHTYLVGPAGTGKSHMAHQAADAREQKFHSISLTMQTPVSALAGYMDAAGKYHGTQFRDAVEFGGLMLIDEIDHGHPNTVGFANAATSNGEVGFPDGMVKVHPNFRLVATANTFGRGATRLHVGATQLDAATLDRFAMVEVLYDEALEDALIAATGVDASTQRKVSEYVRKLRRNAEANPSFKAVISPRGAVRLAKGLARGKTWDAAVTGALRHGVDDATWQKLNA